MSAYARDAGALYVAAARADIDRFVAINHDNLDVAIRQFPVLPAFEPGETAADFLRWLNGELVRCQEPLGA